MLVQKHHAGLRRHGYLLLGHPPVEGEEHSLTALTAFRLGGEIEEESPRCLGSDPTLVRVDGNVVGVVICKMMIVSREGPDGRPGPGRGQWA